VSDVDEALEFYGWTLQKGTTRLPGREPTS
jgi:hypothetical protein